jgi:hypothetical protein
LRIDRPDKDESLDRLLKHPARARSHGRSQGSCLDAETLAAWMDDSLPPAERAAAETHAADCDRCLAVLASIAKTSPPPSAAPRPSWLSVRWLVPLTSAAVAIAAWVLISPGSRAPLQSPSAPAVDAVKPDEPARQLERDAPVEARPDAQEKKADPARESTRDREQADSRPLTRSNARGPAAVLDKATPAAQAPPPVAVSRPSPPVAAAAPPPPPPARAEALDERAQLQARTAAPLPHMIVSPDPAVRWRFAERAVERSTDGGRTWQPQTTAAASGLLAGASPSSSVCWIVGRSGLVLVSTDGETWRRLDFPDAKVDIVSVSALDGLAATVVTADGRSFQTTDGGRSWKF